MPTIQVADKPTLDTVNSNVTTVKMQLKILLMVFKLLKMQ